MRLFKVEIKNAYLLQVSASRSCCVAFLYQPFCSFRQIHHRRFRTAASLLFRCVRRVLVVCCSLYPLILLLHGFQGGDDLRLRRASIFAKQALLTSTPDGGIAFRHGNSDGVGVYSVRNHFRVTHHGQDRVARGVELLPATVSVLREGVGGMCQRAKLGRMG